MSNIVITPLGTISPYLKGNGNCPGFLVEYNEKKILLDCGNGITRLLSFPKNLEDLHVFITHFHKDHFGDLGALQYASYVYHNLGLLDKKIKVCLPKNDYCFEKCAIKANKESYADYIDISNFSKFNLDDLEILCEDNKSHSIESYMIKLQNESFKVVYTSDVGTTYFDSLVDFCRGADLIICESSFLQKHHSQSKTHLTAYDTGKLARLANAKRLLLTHFWPEEDKRSYLEEAKMNFDNVEIAEEGRTVIIGD